MAFFGPWSSSIALESLDCSCSGLGILGLYAGILCAWLKNAACFWHKVRDRAARTAWTSARMCQTPAVCVLDGCEAGGAQVLIWVVVKIMVPVWVP